MVITKEKGCAAISTMVAQPFSCKASIGIGTNPMPVSFASKLFAGVGLVVAGGIAGIAIGGIGLCRILR